ncbi:D-TA family PLP-dependent enzyme [Lutimonas halocynthiae]|uniref:D-TA family PLP-dependent enzyme n=1 Tax=Lutimonas halocynthiae TaxID=1446477 RepID=UPI0025B3C0E5|nr:D-TA family PLP-dependent enzyme [Lutimonas halocynthiae]MDN3643486.1 D-TA family PLP-dependent enzyme [Lutimonas halocynthiae]
MDWYELKGSNKVESPSLLVYPDRIQYNAELMLKIAKDPQRLRPHIKTHKMAEIIQIQLELGISKFKCATLSEAALLGKCGAKDILLAMQPVGVQIEKFLSLTHDYPNAIFSTLVDNERSAKEINKQALGKKQNANIWLDINNGMNRTGISPDNKAVNLYKWLLSLPGLKLKGLHVYDGHIHTSKIKDREDECDKAFLDVELLSQKLEALNLPKPLIIAGGTPTFPIHEKRPGVELSPGTPLLWDHGYGINYQDLKFLPAAVLLTKIISKPGPNLLCFDLGHKSVASEMKLPRVHFLGNKDSFTQISQSEEHLVVECKDNSTFKIGDAHYALPIHICPTVAKYPYVFSVKNHEISGKWQVAARDHYLK